MRTSTLVVLGLLALATSLEVVQGAGCPFKMDYMEAQTSWVNPPFPVITNEKQLVLEPDMTTIESIKEADQDGMLAFDAADGSDNAFFCDRMYHSSSTGDKAWRNVGKAEDLCSLKGGGVVCPEAPETDGDHAYALAIEGQCCAGGAMPPMVLVGAETTVAEVMESLSKRWPAQACKGDVVALKNEAGLDVPKTTTMRSFETALQGIDGQKAFSLTAKCASVTVHVTAGSNVGYIPMTIDKCRPSETLQDLAKEMEKAFVAQFPGKKIAGYSPQGEPEVFLNDQMKIQDVPGFKTVVPSDQNVDAQSEIRLLVRFTGMTVWRIRHPLFSPAVFQVPASDTARNVMNKAGEFFKMPVSKLEYDTSSVQGGVAGSGDIGESVTGQAATSVTTGASRTVMCVASTEGGIAVHGIDYAMPHNSVVTLMPNVEVKEAFPAFSKFFSREVVGLYTHNLRLGDGAYSVVANSQLVKDVPGFNDASKTLNLVPRFKGYTCVVLTSGSKTKAFNVLSTSTVADLLHTVNTAAHMFGSEIVNVAVQPEGAAPLAVDRAISTVDPAAPQAQLRGGSSGTPVPDGSVFPLRLYAVADAVWGRKAVRWMEGLGLTEFTRKQLDPIALAQGRNFINYIKSVITNPRVVANDPRPGQDQRSDRQRLMDGINLPSSLKACIADTDCTPEPAKGAPADNVPETFEACMGDHVANIHVTKRCMLLNSGDYPLVKFEAASGGKTQQQIIDDLINNLPSAAPPSPSYNAHDDAALQFSQCKNAGAVQNQGKCGTCWAYASASAYSMRLCKQTKGKANVMLSPGSLFILQGTGDTPETSTMAAGLPPSGEVETPMVSDDTADAIIRFNHELASSPTSAYKSIRRDAGKGGRPEVCRPLQCVNVKKDGVVQWAATAPIAHRNVCAATDNNKPLIPAMTTVFGKDFKTGAYEIEGFIRDYKGATQMVYTELLQNGPLTVPIKVMVPGAAQDRSLWKYRSGVFSPIRFLGEVDHSVVLVGWGTRKDPITGKDDDYWIMQNSYGNKWWPSRDGLFRVQRGFDMECLLRAKKSITETVEGPLECGMDYFFALELLAQQLDGLQAPKISEETLKAYTQVYDECHDALSPGKPGALCKNGGVPYRQNGDCKCVCPDNWGGRTCEECVNLDCPKSPGKILNPQTCECQCEQTTRFGGKCEHWMRVSACPNEHGLGAKLIVKEWDTRGEPFFADDGPNVHTIKLRTDGWEANVKFKLPSDFQEAPFEVAEEVLPAGVLWEDAYKQVAYGEDEFGRINRGSSPIELDKIGCMIRARVDGQAEARIGLYTPIKNFLESNQLASNTVVTVAGHEVDNAKNLADYAHYRRAEDDFVLVFHSAGAVSGAPGALVPKGAVEVAPKVLQPVQATQAVDGGTTVPGLVSGPEFINEPAKPSGVVSAFTGFFKMASNMFSNPSVAPLPDALTKTPAAVPAAQYHLTVRVCPVPKDSNGCFIQPVSWSLPTPLSEGVVPLTITLVSGEVISDMGLVAVSPQASGVSLAGIERYRDAMAEMYDAQTKIALCDVIAAKAVEAVTVGCQSASRADCVKAYKTRVIATSASPSTDAQACEVILGAGSSASELGICIRVLAGGSDPEGMCATEKAVSKNEAEIALEGLRSSAEVAAYVDHVLAVKASEVTKVALPTLSSVQVDVLHSCGVEAVAGVRD